MYEKYRTAAFGRCPHVFCQGQPVLPVGLSDLPRNYTVNVFCPRCHGLFFPKSTRQANIDGAYFGTTFPHLYLITHPVSFSTTRNVFIFMLLTTFLSTGRIWYQQSPHRRMYPVCMVSKSTKAVYTTRTTKKGNSKCKYRATKGSRGVLDIGLAENEGLKVPLPLACVKVIARAHRAIVLLLNAVAVPNNGF